ncbi:PREDICTED: U3 small nucleolar RNA-associated protein 18 homolog [Dufourea novaeangliae]|uniref:U3 small nucleolar RNA-associated protein 18 like protein n=1 Tax=Dufourea novaeangliae TaxID=178035 RepID=A0A154PJ66_DUFNO|nr:PREDICTED: U3 small nucleolar RNA-associated protein 18 homolog [Dufourea novaeangliae]KZC11853.1 U3 small nucleolar RNA-associated protein 18 like protein [Dufourea novaeangliae]
MNEITTKKNKMKTQKSGVGEKLPKKRRPTKTLYDKKFTAPLKKKRKNEYDPKEEARLERIVFGDPSDILNNLSSSKDFIESSKSDSINANEIISIDDNVSDDSDVPSDDNIDTNSQNKTAWVDEDDEQYSVQAATKAQNRRLPADIPEKLYKDFLHNKYTKLVGTPKWAELKKTDKKTDELDDEILKHSCHLEKLKLKNLPKSIIDIKAMTPINKETHIEGPVISSLEFHPSSTVALVAGTSGTLSLFQIDGIENNKLHSMEYKKFPISVAKFLKNGTEVLVGSQYYPHCHSYNLLSGKTYRIPLPHGVTNMQNFEVSPDGEIIALPGRLGEIYLLTSSSKELIGTLKMNGRCRAVCFTPDSKTLITHGDSCEMYIWDINSRSCIHRAVDDGCLSCASISMSPSGQFVATGSKQGVVNLYDSKTVLQNRNPVPLKILLNLVTSITSLKFNSYSEILAMASDKKYNAFKMVHLPSFTVFSNFPTFQTTISMPEAIDFSPGSGYLGISNRSGSAFLYRLKHYGNY